MAISRTNRAVALDAREIRKSVSIARKPTPNDYKSDGYEQYRAEIQTRVTQLLAQYDGKVFRTDARNLFEVYLRNLPARAKKYCNCNTCRRFFNDYAGLVVIDDAGRVVPLLWGSAHVPPTYAGADEALASKVRRASIIGVKLFDKALHGVPATRGGWSHFSFSVPFQHLTISKLKETGELEAEKREEYGIVERALQDWTLTTLNTAVEILNTDVLYRAEKVIAPVRWLRDLAERVKKTRSERLSKHLIWRSVAHAPTGFCHPRSAVFASLLDDIQRGLPFETASKSFAAKMHPLQYRRPQAAPKQQNVLQATRAFEKLGLDRSLLRRYADLSEVPKIWEPASLRKPRGVNEIAAGPFRNVQTRMRNDHLVRSTRGPERTMTYVKFRDTLLPIAKKIELRVADGPYYAITTAVDPNAPPILQWDHEDERNPFAWYTYVHGSSPRQWGLCAGTYVNVLGITIRPCHWRASSSNFAESALFLLDGAADSRNTSAAIFPETLKSDLHPYRSTIESYSLRNPLRPAPDEPACGWGIGNGADVTTHLRVTTKSNVVHQITLDRYD